MIYSYTSGVHQPVTEKSKALGKYAAAGLAIVLAIVWFELIYFAATHHFPNFPSIPFGHRSTSAGVSNAANKSTASSKTKATASAGSNQTPAAASATLSPAATSGVAGGVGSGTPGVNNFASTADPATWTTVTSPAPTPAVGGLGGGLPAIDPSNPVPDSNSGLPVPLPYTVTVPPLSVQSGDKQVIGTTPIGVTLN